MALQLSEEQASGISGDYWKITDISLCGEDSCKIYVSLFKDQTARDAGKDSVITKIYRFEGGDNPCSIVNMNVLEDNPFTLCYDKLKTLDEFTGAVDV